MPETQAENSEQSPTGANRTPESVLREVFGFTTFRGSQRAVIEQVAAGGDAVVLMPTGGGKSLCYQVPALLRPGLGVVVSPLIALMKDQVDFNDPTYRSGVSRRRGIAVVWSSEDPAIRGIRTPAAN
jgi:superfamily II DNA helicase RecQ